MVGKERKALMRTPSNSLALAMIAQETERLYEMITPHYEDPEGAPDRIAEFILATMDAAELAFSQEPSPEELKYSSLSPKAVAAAKRQKRNKRKAQRRARKVNR